MTVFEATKELIGILMGMGCPHNSDLHVHGQGARMYMRTKIKTTAKDQPRQLILEDYTDGSMKIFLFVEDSQHSVHSTSLEDTTLPKVAEWLAGKRNLTL